MDPDNLELTPYPFKVKRTVGMKGVKEGEEFTGFVITMCVDPNDAFGVDSINLDAFPYEAKIKNDKEIDILAPLLEFHERGGHDEAIRDKLEKIGFTG